MDRAFLLDQLRSRVPLMCQALVASSLCSAAITVVLWAFTSTTPLVLGLGNTPLFTLHFGEVYRLVTSPFTFNVATAGAVVGSAVWYVLSLVWMVAISQALETVNGSLPFAFLLLRLQACINIVFLLLVYTLVVLFNLPFLLVLSRTAGWIPLILCLETIMCLSMPAEMTRQLFFIPVPIPVRYFPWCLLAIMTLFGSNQGLPYDLLCGILVAYLEAYKYLLPITPGVPTFQAWEGALTATWPHLRGFVPSSAVPFNSFGPSSSNASLPTMSGPSSLFANQPPSFFPPIMTAGTPTPNRHQATSRRGSSTSSPIQETPAPAAAIDGAGSEEDSKKRREQLRKAALNAAEVRRSKGENSANVSTINDARLSSSSSAAASSSTGRQEATPFEFDHELLLLQDMGFNAVDAKRALIKHNGNVDAATTELS